MKFKDLTFEKIKTYDPFCERANKIGMVSEWVARNSWGNSVAFGATKKECVKDAREYIKRENCKYKKYDRAYKKIV